ncbi:MAG TPA: rRNA maturation RNase YbeY, partial [Microbacteriaceae bacterium]
MSIEINNESMIAVDEPALQRLAIYALDHLNVHPDAEL